MTFACLNRSPLPNCTPMCTRWGKVNAGEPITYFHETSTYTPGSYQGNVDDATPDAYLARAISLWEDLYGCGTLFEQVDNQGDADLHIFYVDRQDGDPVGQALCVCDEDDEVCVKQTDHTDVFAAPSSGTGLPQQTIKMFLDFRPNADNYSENLFINIVLHELGHALGMGHVYGLGVDSVMAETDLQDVRLYDFDQEQLDARYPCDCVLQSNLTRIKATDLTVENSAERCPGCWGVQL